MGEVLQAQAAVRQKEINLSWTDIVAPIVGRIGPARVTPGNLVGPTPECSPPSSAATRSTSRSR